MIDPGNGAVALIAYGTEELMKSLSMDDFVVYVDAAEKMGQQELAVAVEGPNDADWLISPVNATINIR